MAKNHDHIDESASPASQVLERKAANDRQRTRRSLKQMIDEAVDSLDDNDIAQLYATLDETRPIMILGPMDRHTTDFWMIVTSEDLPQKRGVETDHIMESTSVPPNSFAYVDHSPEIDLSRDSTGLGSVKVHVRFAQGNVRTMPGAPAPSAEQVAVARIIKAKCSRGPEGFGGARTAAEKKPSVAIIGRSPEPPLLKQSPAPVTPGGEWSGPLLTVAETLKRMHLDSEEAVRKRVEERSLIGWRDEANRVAVPAGQIDGEGRVIDGVVDILELFKDPISSWSWMNRSNRNTGGIRPIEALIQGRIDEVRNAALMNREGAFG